MWPRKAQVAASASLIAAGKPRDEAAEIEWPMKNAAEVIVATTHKEVPYPHLRWTPFYKQRTTDVNEIMRKGQIRFCMNVHYKRSDKIAE